MFVFLSSREALRENFSRALGSCKWDRYDIPNFRWADVTDKDEIGKGSFGSVMKGNYIPEKKTVVVKRFFGEGDSNLSGFPYLQKHAQMP